MILLNVSAPFRQLRISHFPLRYYHNRIYVKRHGRSITQYCVRACASATTTTAAILASHQIPLAYNAPRYSASRAIDITSPSSPPDSEYGVTSDETRREKRELGRAGGIRGAGSRGGLIEEERRRGPVAFRAFRCARSLAPRPPWFRMHRMRGWRPDATSA